MQLNLDEQVIQEALNKSASSAIVNAVGTYEVRSAIEERVANAVLQGALTQALDSAIETLDLQQLTSVLAQELSRAVTAGAVRIIRESVVETLLRLRKIPSYDDQRMAAARAEIMAKVFKD